MIGHDGGTIGQYSFLRVSPEKRIAVAMLTNGGNAMSLYKEIVGELFGKAIRRREPELPQHDPSLRIAPDRYLGRYANIQSTIEIDAQRGALRLSMTPKGEIGTRLTHLPIGFIDRQTAVLCTGTAQLDQMPWLFSELDDDRYTYVQVGLRQYRRAD